MISNLKFISWKTAERTTYVTSFGATTRSSIANELSESSMAKRPIRDIEEDIVEIACDLVGLWENPKIAALARFERNAAIEDTRNKLIEAVNKLLDKAGVAQR